MIPRTFTRLNKFLAGLPTTELMVPDYKYLGRAEELSRSSTRPQFKVGSVITQKNQIMGQGCNNRKTHPFQAKWNKFSPYLHAEMVALLEAQKRADFDPTKATVYVTRYGRSKVFACSYPCEYCWAALNYVGITDVVCYDQYDRPVRIRCE